MSELKQWAETASDGTDYVLAYADGLYCVTDSKGNVVCEFIRAEPEARVLTVKELREMAIDMLDVYHSLKRINTIDSPMRNFYLGRMSFVEQYKPILRHIAYGKPPKGE